MDQRHHRATAETEGIPAVFIHGMQGKVYNVIRRFPNLAGNRRYLTIAAIAIAALRICPIAAVFGCQR